jgi:hypothetical protein
VGVVHVVIVVVVAIMMIAATLSYFFEFVTAFIGLPAVLAMFFNRLAQSIFRSVHIPFTSLIRARGQR